MAAPAHAETARFPCPAGFGFRSPNLVAATFVGLIALQTLGFLMLGTGRAGRSVSLFILVTHNLLAVACAVIAFSRARGVAALFWFLYTISLVTLLIPTAFGTYDTVFARSTLSASTWRVLFCLYGAPILMLLFLPETDRERSRAEVLLGLFQVAIVVGITFTSLFLLPVQKLLPADALLRNVSVSNLESVFLLAALSVRLLFTRVAAGFKDREGKRPAFSWKGDYTHESVNPGGAVSRNPLPPRRFSSLTATRQEMPPPRRR